MSVKSQRDRPKEGCHHATRFRVFRFIREYVGRGTVWPSSYEVAETLGISHRSAVEHMRALEGAAGLPKVKRRGRGGNTSARYWMGLGLQRSLGGDFVPDPYCTPVDKLIA